MVVNNVIARTVGIPGRCINDVGQNAFVIDAASHSGGGGRGVTPADSFLAGVASCAVTVIENRAHEIGVDVTSVQCEITAERSEEDTSSFLSIRLELMIRGVSPEMANELMEYFSRKCPLYKCIEKAIDNVVLVIREEESVLA